MGYGNISPSFKGGQETNCRLNNLAYATIVGGARLSLWFFRTAENRSAEIALRQTLKPLWNRI